MSSEKYYTNVTRSGNRLLVREIRNGKRRKFRTEYHPTLYIPSNDPTGFKTPEGLPVAPYNPGTMGDCYQFIKKYKDVDNFKFYGNTAYEYAFINEHYPGHLEYDLSHLVVCNLDIEVESKNGFCEPKDATNEVTAITIKSSVDGVYHVFACQPFDDKEYNQEHKDTTIVYHQCENEEDLLEQFLDLWELQLQPDICIGWNVLLFDITYLVCRITKLLSFEAATRLSPWRTINESNLSVFNKPEVVYDIAGVAILDYLIIYRKNVLEPRESYRLDYIAEVELKEHKLDYSEYGTLQELFERNFKVFIEYNIHDVRLVDRIDAKRKLIELQLLVAYHAKVNYVDVHSPVKIWDTHICNHLLGKGIVVPQRDSAEKNSQFIGAYVMKPVPGMYEWIAAFDVQSLYPRTMQTLNIGMETQLTQQQMTPEMRNYQKYLKSNLMLQDEDGKLNVNPDAIVNGLTDQLIEHFREHDVTVAANGIFYRRSPQSFYSVMIQELFENRLEYKKKAKDAKLIVAKLKEEHTPTEESTALLTKAETDTSIYDLKQSSMKILLNAFYGALGNMFFRFSNIDNAEAITTTGQFIIQFIARGVNAYLNKVSKTTDCRYIVYSDTDSVYVTFKPIVEKYHPQSNVMKKVDFVDKICKEAIQPEINRLFQIITNRYLNGVGDYLLMNRELIGDKAIWTAKKRYLVNVRDKEGIKKDPAEIKYMGLEIKKATVPKFCRDAMEKAVRIIIDQDQKVLFTFVADTKAEFLKQPVENISFPRGVNGLIKYGASPQSVLQPLTDLWEDSETDYALDGDIYTKGTPFHTKGVLSYNHLLEELNLTSRYPRIKDGDKIKFFYLLEPNPYNTNTMAFLTKVPPEFKIEQHIDYELQWQKSFIEPLMLILNAIGWDTQPRASLASLFED